MAKAGGKSTGRALAIDYSILPEKPALPALSEAEGSLPKDMLSVVRTAATFAVYSNAKNGLAEAQKGLAAKTAAMEKEYDAQFRTVFNDDRAPQNPSSMSFSIVTEDGFFGFLPAEGISIAASSFSTYLASTSHSTLTGSAGFKSHRVVFS